MNKADKKKLFIIIAIIVVGFLFYHFVIKGNFSGFGRSTTAMEDGQPNMNGAIWKATNLPTSSGNNKPLGTKMSSNYTLMYDPGWAQPSQIPLSTTTTPLESSRYTLQVCGSPGSTTSDTVTDVTIDISNILIGYTTNASTTAKNPSTSAVSSPTIGWAYSPSATDNDKKYYYSGTSISAIINPYTYTGSAGETVIAAPLLGVKSSPTLGLSATNEYANFNAYFQYDALANAFMSNDTQLIPKTYLSSSNAYSDVDMRYLSLVYWYKPPSTGTNTFAENMTTISYAQAQGIPANAIFYPNDPGAPKEGEIATGTPGATMAGATVTNNSQRYRTNVILGVLTSMHTLFNGTPSGASGSGTPSGYYSYTTPATAATAATPATAAVTTKFGTSDKKITSDLSDITIYGIGATNGGDRTIPSTQRLESSVTQIYITPNVSHAIYLTVMARDNWINNQILNINSL